MPILLATSLGKRFAEQIALDAVDFEVGAGEVHALVGQNGSGKSTLVKILAGYHQPDDPAAHLEVGGHAVELGDPASAHRAGLRFVHQDLALVGSLDACENIALVTGYQQRRGRINWREMHRAIRHSLHDIGYDIDTRRPIAELTQAEQVGVAVVRSLGIGLDDEAKVLVFDEPTAALSGPEVRHLFDVFERLAARGCGIVFVTHHVNEVLTAADRVTVLRNGRRVATHHTTGLSRAGLIEEMVGRAVATELASGQRPEGSPQEAILSLSALSGRHLKDFDLEVGPGQVIGITGVTGSGREEVAALVRGMERPTSGTITFAGHGPDASATAHGSEIGIVPADRRLHGIIPNASVRENLTLGDVKSFKRRGRLRHDEERAETVKWCKSLNIVVPGPETPVHTLSGGNQQKVVLARWLRRQPLLLLLDEPGQGVDVVAKLDIYRAILAYASSRGAAVLVCSTDSEELCHLCERVIILYRGRIEHVIEEGALTADAIDSALLHQSA